MNKIERQTQICQNRVTTLNSGGKGLSLNENQLVKKRDLPGALVYSPLLAISVLYWSCVISPFESSSLSWLSV